MHEDYYMKMMCEAIGCQVRGAVKARDRTDLAGDLGEFLPRANRISQIGSDPMSISLLFSA
jgi:hypothetical protein